MPAAIRPRAQATSWAASKTWRSARCVSGPRCSAGWRRAGALTRVWRAQNQFDSIDLSDNEIVKLEGFPPLKRLSTLLVHNNRIARIGPGLAGEPPAGPKQGCLPLFCPAAARRLTRCRPAAALPKLETLGLANNRLSNLGVRGIPRGARAAERTMRLLSPFSLCAECPLTPRGCVRTRTWSRWRSARGCSGWT